MADNTPPDDPRLPNDLSVSGEADIDSEVATLLEDIHEPEKRRILLSIASHRGPLPHPATLERYGLLLPSAVERIFHMAEIEQLNRHQVNLSAMECSKAELEIQRLEQKDDSWIRKACLAAGLIAFLFLIAAILFCVSNGLTEGAIILGGVGVFGIISEMLRLARSSKSIALAEPETDAK